VAAFAYRAPWSKGSDRLCLQIPSAWAVAPKLLGASPGVRECGSVRLEVSQPVVTEAPLRGSRRSVVAVATGSDVRDITITMGSATNFMVRRRPSASRVPPRFESALSGT